nr:hypothetical protein [uncultured Bacteroides sp.]
MVVSHKKVFSRRKFVSVGLFLTLAVLVITAIMIQFFEAFEAAFFIHLFTVIHIFTGLAFTILSVLHIIKNWQSMRIYIKNKGVFVNRETIYAFLLTMIAILTGVLFAYSFLR